MRHDYDHSNHFISSFIGEHPADHAEAVRNLHGQIAGSEIAFFEGGYRFLEQDPDAFLFIAQTLERYCKEG
ncbi:MAG: hypothetical protein AB2531_14380 [Candidatus Thiodiazotropha sp.]